MAANSAVWQGGVQDHDAVPIEEGVLMLVSDLLHSCANDRVAEAAISSIGGSFASGLQREADSYGLSLGGLASGRVRTFARRASERDWRDLAKAVRNQDFPVLTGLQVILSRPDLEDRA